VEALLFTLFGIWILLEVSLFGRFLLFYYRLLRFLEDRYHDKWMVLTTREGSGVGPGYPVWGKVMAFLKDPADNLADSHVEHLKVRTRSAYRYFVISSLAGPLILGAFFFALMLTHSPR